MEATFLIQNQISKITIKESENSNSERISQPAEENATTIPQAQNPINNAFANVISNVSKGKGDRINKKERKNGIKSTKNKLNNETRQDIMLRNNIRLVPAN